MKHARTFGRCMYACTLLTSMPEEGAEPGMELAIQVGEAMGGPWSGLQDI
jgi:hypothetical protein